MHLPVLSTAVFSQCRNYRHYLSRRWDEGMHLTWLMLNPSSADHQRNDSTIARVVNHTKLAGFGAARVVNLFDLIATHQADLWVAEKPLSEQGHQWLEETIELSPSIVCAWGNAPSGTLASLAFETRLAQVLPTLEGKRLLCLGRNDDGSPTHPVARRSMRLQAFGV